MLHDIQPIVKAQVAHIYQECQFLFLWIL